ncbi:MAG: HEAT repeat domain-containing protein [Deltaproteobacteria bacterium]|nr:HEAT repeat domain-containing protein [Deltaproteobacteria bacterium]
MRMADVLFDHSSYSEAESAYKDAVIDGGAGTEAMRKIALYYDLVNNIKEAEKWWRLLLDSPDASFGMKRESAVRLVQLWQRSYTLGKQLPLAEKMLEDEPERIEIALLLATMYLELGKQAECRDVLQGLLKQIGDAVRTAAPGERGDLLDAADHVLVTLDRLNRLQKLWAEAMEAFEEAAAIFPDKVAELKLKTAEYAVLAGRHDRAREAIHAALLAAPADLDVNEDAADLLFKIGDIEKASACLAVIVAKDPSRYDDRFRLSRALVHLGRWDEAASKLSDLVEDCPYDYLGSEALSLLATIIEAGHVDMDLEVWLYKLFFSSKGRDFAGRRLVEIYRDRLGGGARVEKVFTQSPAPGDGGQGDEDWLRRAGKAAAKILVEGPDDVRFKALDVLSHIRDPDLAGSLLKRTSYIKVPGHQVMAIVGISGSLAPEHGPYLVKLVESTSPDVRAAAVLGMAFTGDPAMLDEIEKHYFSSAPEVRASAVLASGLLMARTGHVVDQGASESIMTLLRTRQWRVTYQATILTLGVMGGDEASEQLMNFIASRGRIGQSDKKPTKITAGDPGSLTMRLALLALAAGSFEGPEVTEALIDGCWSGVDAVRDIAGYSLLLETSDPGVVIRPVPSHIPVTQGMRHGRFRVAKILEELISVPDYRFDGEMIEALKPRLEEALETRLHMHASAPTMNNDEVKLLLETLLILDAEVGRTSWLPFSDHLEDGSAGASRAVLASVIHSRLPQLDAILALVLEGPAASRDTALIGLASVMGKMGGKTPPGALVDLATGKHTEHMTASAIMALGSFDSEECVDVLHELLSTKPWSLRVEIVKALASMQSPGAHGLLSIVADKDKSNAVREAAAASLDPGHAGAS